MVDREGRVLGSLSGPYVNAWNIFHRGVGLIVAMDEDQSSEEGRVPMVYIHRRTTMKRIFPSLYDMFFGGGVLSGRGRENDRGTRGGGGSQAEARYGLCIWQRRGGDDDRGGEWSALGQTVQVHCVHCVQSMSRGDVHIYNVRWGK
jgi:hypothetical protein